MGVGSPSEGIPDITTVQVHRVWEVVTLYSSYLVQVLGVGVALQKVW